MNLGLGILTAICSISVVWQAILYVVHYLENKFLFLLFPLCLGVR